METYIPWTLIKRSVRREVITPLDAPQAFLAEADKVRCKNEGAQDTPLVRALGLAHYWQRLLDDGKCVAIAEIATMEGMDVTQVRRFLRLTLLAPNVLEQLITLSNCALDRLLRQTLLLEWSAQSLAKKTL